jgi:hypothetical protein
METMQPKRGLYVSLSLKMLILFTVVFSVIFAVAFFWFYRFATDMALERITQDMVITLHGAADGVDGDELATLFGEGVVRDDGYTDDPRFWAQIDWLATVTGIEPRAKALLRMNSSLSPAVGRRPNRPGALPSGNRGSPTIPAPTSAG